MEYADFAGEHKVRPYESVISKLEADVFVAVQLI